jgi:hypothetical protein
VQCSALAAAKASAPTYTPLQGKAHRGKTDTNPGAKRPSNRVAIQSVPRFASVASHSGC